MMILLTSTLFGWFLTVAALGICFVCTLMVEFSWATVARRRAFTGFTFAVLAVWFVIVIARFAGAA
ncbi:MAG: hypothetical protein WCP28_16390 [Actinomycetes bacterium]